jgi:hypothetical protein
MADSPLILSIYIGYTRLVSRNRQTRRRSISQSLVIRDFSLIIGSLFRDVAHLPVTVEDEI